MLYPEGTPAEEIIEDGWARGFKPEQTVQELREVGYIDATVSVVTKCWEELNNVCNSYLFNIA